MPIATPQRQGQTRRKPGAQSHGSSLSSATPASHATKDLTTAELPNGQLALACRNPHRGGTMRPFVILGLATLVAGACKDAAGPKDTASLGRGLRADLFWERLPSQYSTLWELQP